MTAGSLTELDALLNLIRDYSNGGICPRNRLLADAQLIMQLYDLRREAEMRKARNWWLLNFGRKAPMIS